MDMDSLDTLLEEDESSAGGGVGGDNEQTNCGLSFPFKTRLCIICASFITENDNSDGGTDKCNITSEDFLKSVSVLCDILEIESRFGNNEEWRYIGRDDFAEFVCCKDCGNVLGRLVSLQNLLKTTEADLHKDVKRVEKFIVESAENVELEYSVNTCVEFREEVLKKYYHRRRRRSENQESIPDTKFGIVNSEDALFKKKSIPTSEPKARRSKPFAKTPCKSKQDNNVNCADGNSISNSKSESSNENRYGVTSPTVLISRLTKSDSGSSPSEKQVKSDIEAVSKNVTGGENYECGEFIPGLGSIRDDDEDNDNFESIRVSSDDDDEEFRLSSRRRTRPGKRRKRGRPPKPKVIDPNFVKRPRGRPPKPITEADTPTPKRSRGRPRKVKIENESLNIDSAADSGALTSKSIEDDNESGFKRKNIRTRKVSKNCVVESQENDGTVHDDGYQPSDSPQDHETDQEPLSADSDHDYAPSSAKRKSIEIRRPRRVSRKADTEGSDRPIKKRGRPPTRRYQYARRNPEEDELLMDGPVFKPILVIDSDNVKGTYMFMNLKFEMDSYAISCKHPACNYFVNKIGYFTEQTAFRNIRFHVKFEHRQSHTPIGEESYYFCRCCDAKFTTRKLLIDHIRSQHKEAEPTPTICEVCCDVMQQQHLVKHMLTHKNADEKARALLSKGKRRGRAKDITRPSLYPCDECDKVWKNHTELRIHKQTHVPVELRRTFLCDMCPTKLSSQSTLKLHRDRVHFNHTMERPYVCNICHRAYLRVERSKYDTHMRQHTGELPFQCPQCGKGFRSSHSLVLHERTHEDHSIQCEYCPNWYKNHKYLRRHHFKHHPEVVSKPDRKQTIKYQSYEHSPDFVGPKLAFPCEPCGRVHMYKSQLITHMKHRHKLMLDKNDDYQNMYTFEDEVAGKLRPGFYSYGNSYSEDSKPTEFDYKMNYDV